MNWFPERINERQIAAIVMSATILLSAIIIHYAIIPTYGNLRLLRQSVQTNVKRLAVLSQNIMVRQSVDEKFSQIGKKTIQTETDEITISQFLREIEELARKPNVMLINMKPTAPKGTETVRQYEVKLSVAGRIQDVLQFLHALTTADSIVGLRSISLRGVQAGQRVECSLTIWTVRLLMNRHIRGAVTETVERGKIT